MHPFTFHYVKGQKAKRQKKTGRERERKKSENLKAGGPYEAKVKISERERHTSSLLGERRLQQSQK